MDAVTKKLLNDFCKTQPALNVPGTPAAVAGIQLGDLIESAQSGVKLGLDAVSKKLLNDFQKSQPALQRPGVPAATSGILLGDIIDAALQQGSASGAGKAYATAMVGPFTVTVASVGHGLLEGGITVVTNGSDPDVDGSHVIHKITDDAFSFVISADPGASGTLDFDLVLGALYTALPTSYLVTVTSVAHNLGSGVSVTVSLATDAALDGAHVVTVAGVDTLVFPSAAPATVGTLSWAAAHISSSLSAADLALLNSFQKSQPALQLPGVPAANSGILLGDLLNLALA
jgi:hypothetical protein